MCSNAMDLENLNIFSKIARAKTVAMQQLVSKRGLQEPHHTH